jgi:hypothetical protein
MTTTLAGNFASSAAFWNFWNVWNWQGAPELIELYEMLVLGSSDPHTSDPHTDSERSDGVV